MDNPDTSSSPSSSPTCNTSPACLQNLNSAQLPPTGQQPELSLVQQHHADVSPHALVAPFLRALHASNCTLQKPPRPLHGTLVCNPGPPTRSRHNKSKCLRLQQKDLPCHNHLPVQESQACPLDKSHKPVVLACRNRLKKPEFKLDRKLKIASLWKVHHKP